MGLQNVQICSLLYRAQKVSDKCLFWALHNMYQSHSLGGETWMVLNHTIKNKTNEYASRTNRLLNTVRGKENC